MAFHFNDSDPVSRYFVIHNYAKKCTEDKKMMDKHFLKNEACLYGVNCSNIYTCPKAHFKKEYNVPMCLYMEFCKNKDCNLCHNNEEKKAYEENVYFKYNSLNDWILDIKKMKEDLDMIEIVAKLYAFSF